MSRTHSAGFDEFGMIHSRFALGYVKSIDNRREDTCNQDSGILSEDASTTRSSADRSDSRTRARTSAFGYVMNQQGQGTLFNSRGQSLVDAAYRSIGYSEFGGSFVA